MIASSDDLEEIARHGEKAKTKTLTGWRYDIFGQFAVALCEGRLSISYNPDAQRVVINE